MQNIRVLKLKLIIFFLLLLQAKLVLSSNVPFSTDTTGFTIWNGKDYTPFFVKGVNLGIAVPGTFPGELAAGKDDYYRWFDEIKEAGFNCIRIYTLHFPRFYEALDSFNNANKTSPLYFIQGVWLEEEAEGFNNNLYNITGIFKNEIEEDIDCVFGNKTISARAGKAYGNYNTDASEWCMAFIIGREVHPEEVLGTNNANPSISEFNGKHFAISGASPSEAWFTGILDHTLDFMDTKYKSQRPLSISSWPTLDPIKHTEEINRYEDTASVDLSKIRKVDAGAGFFISYHIYPFYPDFIGAQNNYKTFEDEYGPNSYLAYLNDLKTHYNKIPVIVAEYGVPSSWVIAHYTSSGMNHGGFDEYNQGLVNMRLLESVRRAGYGGGIQFAWIDEWFKRTWIADPVDYRAEDRVLWHNLASPEQNFGLKGFNGDIYKETIIPLDENKDITYLKAKVTYSCLELEVGLKKLLDVTDEMWIALDTYFGDSGESKLPSGETIPSRSEYLIKLNNYSATLYVTQAYDLFGIWHGVSSPEQLYHTVPTDGKPWEVVRLKNNLSQSEVQYIGNLQTNTFLQPVSSKDAVYIDKKSITIKLPWSYINFVAPDKMRVMNDFRNTATREDTISDGIVASVFYKKQWFTNEKRFTWEPWNKIDNIKSLERKKTSFSVIKNSLQDFNNPAIAFKDSFYFEGPDFPVSVTSANGLLKNDFDLDGDYLVSLIVTSPKNGQLFLENDGSFSYLPKKGFIGTDTVKYCVYDGYSLSDSNLALFKVATNSTTSTRTGTLAKPLLITPNPAGDLITISNISDYAVLQIFDISGKLKAEINNTDDKLKVDLSNYQQGTYFVIARSPDKIISAKFIKQ